MDHVAANGVSQDEYEEVVERGFLDRVRSRTAFRRWVVRDYTDDLRFLITVFELDDLTDEEAWGITPVTAYDPQTPPQKA